jgi:hypothetical protein
MTKLFGADMLYYVLDSDGETLASIRVLTGLTPERAWSEAIASMDPEAPETLVLERMPALTFHPIH